MQASAGPRGPTARSEKRPFSLSLYTVKLAH